MLIMLCICFMGRIYLNAPKKARAKECKLCKRKLPSDYSKLTCKICINQVLAEETPDLLSSMKEMIQEEIQSSLKSLQPSTNVPSTSSVIVRDFTSDEEVKHESYC